MHNVWTVPVVRVLLALALCGLAGTWISSAPTTTAPPAANVVVAADRSASAAPYRFTEGDRVAMRPTTTVAPVRPVRASRSAVKPRVVTQTVPVNDGSTRARVIAAIYSHPWNAALMVKVGSCESGLNPWARNGKHHGIFQIANSTPGLIEEHVALAFSMWSQRGLAPWYPSRHCWG